MGKIKIAAVTYLNTKPFVYGIHQSGLSKEIDLMLDYPAGIADELQNGNADVALLPVAVIPEIQQAEIITDYCIGCDGAVSSVCLYSDVPIEEAKEIFFDYQSRTSVELAKILLSDFWKLNLKSLPARSGYENLIGGSRAGLIIGDRALQARSKFKFVYDLGAAWKQFTGRPFVFAAWVANKRLPSEFISAFNNALKFGVEHSGLVADLNSKNFPGIDIHDYLTRKINFNFDEEKRKALDTFLSFIKEKLPVTTE